MTVTSLQSGFIDVPLALASAMHISRSRQHRHGIRLECPRRPLYSAGSSSLEKAACGPFSDSGSVSVSKRRDFCRLLRCRLFCRKSDRLLATDEVAHR
jgi:hypothetical protein